jgi:NAD+ synthase (glutamine-hydrolysing)
MQETGRGGFVEKPPDLCYVLGMKIALAQIAPRLGTVTKNLDLHLRLIERARRQGADLVVFPELSLTGYTLRDLTEEVALDPRTAPAFKRLRAVSRSLDVVVGFVEESPGERGILYNSAAYLSRGKLLHVHRKIVLPTYGLFEEGKFFMRGRELRTFAAPAGRAGLLICRDFLQPGLGYLLQAGGAELIIAVSAAPGRGSTSGQAFASSRMWELMGETLAFFGSAFVLYCNRVGFEDGVAFAGGSFLFGPDGRLIGRCPCLDEDFKVLEINPAAVRSARRRMHFRKEDRPEVVLEGLRRIVQGHDH